MGKQTCGDCGVLEGQLHRLGCDMERCPFCNGQLIGCDCCYEKLGFIVHPTYRLPQDIYENGLPDNLMEKWDSMLEEKGRIPYILYPIICARCGKLWPDFFMVPHEEWNYYIEPGKRDKVLCRSCYDEITNLIDTYTE